MERYEELMDRYLKEHPCYTKRKRYLEASRIIAERIGRFVEEYTGEDITKMSLLDEGCGVGHITGYLSQLFKSVTGIDSDNNRITIAKAFSEKMGFDTALLIADIEEKPVKDSAFDVVVSQQVIEHLKNPKRYLKDTKRVLKKGGGLYLATPNKLYPIEQHYSLPLLSLLPKKFANAYVKITRKAETYEDINCFTYWGIQKLLLECGFSDWFDFTKVILELPKEYGMDQYMGAKAKILEIIPIELRKRLIYFTPSWIFLCKKP